MNIHGYTVRRDPAGSWRITPPGELTWQQPAASLETARKWIEQHQAERRAVQAQFARMVKRVEVASIIEPGELRD